VSYQFSLAGSYLADPLSGDTSLDPSTPAPIDEQMTLDKRSVFDVKLTTDALAAVPMGGITSAHIVILKAIEGKVLAKLTSVAGIAQIVPVDKVLILISEGDPITAISLTRTPALLTTVRVFLGEKA